MELSGRRRVRGFAAAQLFITILLVNYNLRKIASFLWEEEHGNPAPENPIMRRRDRVWDNPLHEDTRERVRDRTPTPRQTHQSAADLNRHTGIPDTARKGKPHRTQNNPTRPDTGAIVI